MEVRVQRQATPSAFAVPSLRALSYPAPSEIVQSPQVCNIAVIPIWPPIHLESFEKSCMVIQAA